MGQQSQSDRIRQLSIEGRTMGQISQDLGCRYQTVWRTLHRTYQGQMPRVNLVQVAPSQKSQDDGMIVPGQLSMDI